MFVWKEGRCAVLNPCCMYVCIGGVRLPIAINTPLLLLRRSYRSPVDFYNTLLRFAPLNSAPLHSTPLHHRFYTIRPRSHAVRSTHNPAQPRSLNNAQTHTAVYTTIPPQKPLYTLRSARFASLHAGANRERKKHSRTEEQEVKNNKRLPWQTGVENADGKTRLSKNDGPVVRKTPKPLVKGTAKDSKTGCHLTLLSLWGKRKRRDNASLVAPSRGAMLRVITAFSSSNGKGKERRDEGLTPPRPWGPHGGSPRSSPHPPPSSPPPASATTAPVPQAACLARPPRPPWGSLHPRRPPGPRRSDR
jgi:hypothetical protein